jgi:pimeloyl-ACP methyl ester carboxylesterase
MPWIDVNGQDIYYVEKGSGQPFVFLHGMSSCGEAWWQQFDAFGERFHVIAYDSVNHGHSSNSPRGEVEPDRTDELESFLAALGLERPILAGNSMGGATITRWAARHPGDAAALIVSGSGVAGGGATPRRSLQPLDSDTLFLPIGDSLTEGFKKNHPRMYERYLRIRSTATRLEYMRNPRPRNPKTIAEGESLAERVGAITSPLLVVVGSLDRAVPNAERLHKLVPGSRYALIEGAPHNVYYEAAEPYNEAVAAFLDDVLGG